MFIVERIVSLFAFAGTLFIACYLISHCSMKQVRTVLFAYLIMLMVFAFNYKPYRTADLYRLREYIQYWVDLPLESLFSYLLNSASPAWVAYAYLVSKLGNVNWLQTGSCLVSFGLSFYFIRTTIEKNAVMGTNRGLLLFSYMAIGAIFLQAISDIRHIMGFTIIAFSLYRELKGKSFWIHIPLYLLAALFHPTAIVLVAARFLSVGFSKKGWRSKIAATILTVPVVLFCYRQGSQYFLSTVAKANSYLTGDEYTYIWEIIIGIAEAVQTIMILRHYQKHYTANEKERYLWLFAMVLQVGSILALPFSYAVFRRYTLFCTMITIPFFGKTLCAEDSEQRNMKLYREWMYLLSAAIFILSFVRGDICGYKFFVLQ